MLPLLMLTLVDNLDFDISTKRGHHFGQNFATATGLKVAPNMADPISQKENFSLLNFMYM